MQSKIVKLGRILAIDYGQKRVGFAVTDELRICANGLDTVHVSKAFDFLTQYIASENVDIIVVGEPKTMDFNDSASARFIEPFVNRLKKTFPNLKIDRFDERFTSKMAFQTMIDAGLSKKQRADKGLVDKISATIILQSYLQQLEIEAERNVSKN
ncbi:MAG: Holliday junction resolvase [Bacteroidetes bacterium]|nr:Holliday junction resolvase [Bacteroidota bacterium]